MKRSVFVGAIASLIAIFPTASILALVWRYPIPFSGYESGFAASYRSLLAVAFYGVLGGFMVVGVLGALAGWVSYRIAKGEEKKARQLSIRSGALVAFALNLILAAADKLILLW